jgi:predicted ester cyclase
VSDPETTEANTRVVRQFYDELWDNRRLNLLDKLVAEDVRFRASLGATIQGREAFGRYIGSVHSAFPDWRHSIDEIFAVGDRIITRMKWAGTHLGRLGNVDPTGARVEYVGAAFFRLEDGVITAGWVVGDTQEVWRALGRL